MKIKKKTYNYNSKKAVNLQGFSLVFVYFTRMNLKLTPPMTANSLQREI